ncbi:thiamine biosynthesis protein ThiS [Aedoeadaptatus nemausensis]|uniref:Thiamine biosynthesis protein ThiS n=1 Tax=Aedoeadaptatus nemausensis TaxID=2582829 RepID=A0A6V6Y5X9_9FIRM|nr:sulfur carrier protein ThiS [Peptoniphilus nemausensis]CAC9931953.1 thiamine biosynthesis protein ThiS [Peptoniphilus nemausensis]
MKINGKTFKLNGPQPLRRVLLEAGFDPEAVALEKNKELIRRVDFDATTVEDEDVLEVFSFTGGG